MVARYLAEHTTWQAIHHDNKDLYEQQVSRLRALGLYRRDEVRPLPMGFENRAKERRDSGTGFGRRPHDQSRIVEDARAD